MVATFIIDWPVLGLLGFVFGASASPDRWWKSRAFVAGLVSAVVFTATALVSYVVAPAWMWMYLLDHRSLTWTVPFIALGYLFVYVVSFAGAVSLRAARPVLPWIAAAVALLMEIALIVVTWDRYHLVGTRLEWSSGVAHELYDLSPTGVAKTVGYMGPLILVTIAVCLFFAYRGSHATPADR